MSPAEHPDHDRPVTDAAAVGPAPGDGAEPPLPDADAAIVAGGAPPSARVPLDRDRIVSEALVFLEEVGPGGLSMRRLGKRLGVEAMSLYRYVPGKEDLLDAVVESLISGMYADPEVLSTPDNGWQDFLQRMAHGVRRVALAHIQAFPLVASRPPEAPWLRPPLRSLDWVESFLAGLTSEGFSDAAAVAAYRSFTSFLLGNLLLEVASHGADIGPLDVVDDGEEDNEALRLHPTVARLRADLAQDHSATEFEEALEQLLERIAATKVELADG
ncbi:TetR/AcrR family transcriptional regulator C-terminal domain-containing protein [Nocardioides kribbensis]|uniref:TetR/AcrR family transcriptional regulator C-terminal domain-containing protein n=1 Tax=Nocardioides kribbensis TaxID=305517 RepID=UPI00187B0595|nr:TetR/AcrR family transcriptional regulator C-terminal domain-containing protein [Nocardioides kribbensis]